MGKDNDKPLPKPAPPAPAKPAPEPPLPPPGHRDYVAGQPVNEEEARKTEQERIKREEP